MKMKNMKFYNRLFLVVGLLFGMGMTSCEDYLTVLPTNSITEDDFWKDKNDLDNVRSAAYKKMTDADVTSRILIWGELRSDNLSLNDMTQTNIQHLQQAILQPTEDMFNWAPFYTGINYCNQVLEHGEAMTEPGNEVDPSFRRGDWNPIKAEMISLRALYYFYLVRSFRNVPYVTKSVTTDAEAMNSRVAATQGVVILNDLLSQLEEAVTYAAEDYGNNLDNKGRFNKRSIYALMADMYLWQGCMLLNSTAKGDVMTNAAGDTLATDSLNIMSADCFQRSIECADACLAYFQQDYDELLDENPGMSAPENERYPYLTYVTSFAHEDVYDNVYNSLWVSKNSTESIFELQYDGVNTVNTTIRTYLSSVDNGLVPEYMVGNNALTGSASATYAPERGFGKVDIRLLETFNYTTANASQPPVHKNIVSSLSISNLEDMTEGTSSSNYSGTNNANWPVYRLSDIMLIKAEAIARSVASTTNAKNDENVNEGFHLCNALFDRSNPALEPTTNTSVSSDLRSDRLNDDYATAGNGHTAGELLTMVYYERQREFVTEGKRWFDIVRQCEATNDPPEVLQNYITLASAVRGRMRTIWALYNPIYSEELRVNGVEYGGQLEQNPVWERYSSN